MSPSNYIRSENGFGPLAANIETLAHPPSETIQSAPFIGELEHDDRQESLWVAKPHGHSVTTMFRIALERTTRQFPVRHRH
jgi:hypothetical protein